MKANLNQLLALFPITVTVTKEIIKASNIEDTSNCIGANTLKHILAKNGYDNIVDWGTTTGEILVNNLKGRYISLESNKHMMVIKRKTKVTLTLRYIK